MKIDKKDVAILVLFLVSCVGFLVFRADKLQLLADETGNRLLNESLSRIVAALCFAVICGLLGYRDTFLKRVKPFGRALLWCIPCLFVVIANFPFSALISGSAQVEKTNLVPLFLLNCFAIGLMEEVLFRGIFQNLLYGSFKKYSCFYAIAANSALFGLWHLANLFDGAPLPATLLQVGYSFLIGAMLSTVTLRTGNIWSAVFLHTLFDVGGLLIPQLGNGVFQDGVFWILTVITGVLCACHVIAYLLRQDSRNHEKKNSSSNF